MKSAEIQSQAQERLERYRKQRKEFIQLIKSQEELARKNPDGYRRKVVAYAWLGYGYVLGVLGLLVLFVAGIVLTIAVVPGGAMVMAKIGIFLIPLIAVVGKALFVKISAPEGERVTRQQAPALWAEVDSLTKELGAPKIHEIVIDMDTNAAAAQRPTLGLFGRYRNHLILGLPLMVTLPKDEMRAMVAHEFGHFSGQHGRVGGWVYRLNETYARIRSSLSDHGSAFLFRKFYNWFQPRFDAVSFTLRRQNEYEADTAAARISGSPAMGRMLTRLAYLHGAVKAGVWNRLAEMSDTQPEPPSEPFANLQGDIGAGLASVDIREKIEKRLALATDYEDTHPSLTDRLNALDAYPTDLGRTVEELREPIGTTAAQEYFGSYLPEIQKRLGAEYVKRVRKGWADYYKGHQKAVAELTRLESIDDKPLTIQEQLDLAFLILRKREDAGGAAAMFDRIVQENPENADALYGLGEAKLALDDERGEQFLRESIKLNVSYTRDAMSLIGDFRFKKSGREGMEEFREEFVQLAHVADTIERERRTFRIGDTLIESTLSPADRSSILEQLRGHKDVKEAFLVAKVVEAGGVKPMNLLLILPTEPIISSRDRPRTVLNTVLKTVKFPSHVMVYVPGHNDRKGWKNRMAMVPNSKLI